MDENKTLLQQIRDKEQEFAKTLEVVRTSTDATITTAKTEAEELICTADKAGKTAAEELFLKERRITETQIGQMKTAAGKNADMVSEKGHRNLKKAAEKVVDFVTLK